ncbi:MAG TPA: MCP four helix bundle domain-containing protein [Verrucomicrobiae bacterium]|nr:MCP four helix bundle domain-containing protein [Verrucomicrobiae bacterium]
MQDKPTERAALAQRMRRLKPVAVLAVILLIVGGTGFLAVRQVKVYAQKIVGDTLPGLAYSGQVNSELSENFVRAMLVINTDSVEERDLRLSQIAEGSQKVDSSLQDYRSTIFEEEEQRVFDRLVAARESYRAVRRQAFDLVKAGKRTEATRMFEAEVMPAYGVQKEAGEALFDYNAKQGKERGRHIETLCRRTEWMVAAICVVIFVSGFFTPFFAIRLPPDVWK